MLFLTKYIIADIDNVMESNHSGIIIYHNIYLNVRTLFSISNSRLY